MDGYTTMDPQSLNELSVEAFLRGASDKFAARHVLEKDPKTISEALQSMKEFQANNKAIFGASTSSLTNSEMLRFRGRQI